MLAHPPFGWWWTSFLHAPLLVTAMWVAGQGEKPRLRTAAGLGAIAGVVAFGPMISWLIAPAGWIGWGLLVAVQVVWFALMAVLVVPALMSRWLPLIAALAWTGIDAWRGIVPFNGFGWGAIAYAHVDGSWLLPVARIVGGRGITLLVVVIGVAAAVVARVGWRQWRSCDAGAPEERLAATRFPMGLLVGALVVSAVAVVEPPEANGTLEVLVAQGNDIRHWEQPADDPPLEIATNLRDDTMAAIAADGVPDLVVWPESSIDRDPWTPLGAPLAPLVAEVAEHAGELITGTTLDGPDPRRNRYVAASQFVGGFDEADRYVKRRLVPFGEYVPMRPWLDWFPPLEQVPRDAISGSHAKQLTTRDAVPIAVVICFETLFTDLVRENVLAGSQPAELVLTVTNDASFQDSAEPAQHLAQSQLRAVETGRWVVHAALSGASAFIDPDGRPHQTTELFARDTIRHDVPLVQATTPYLVVGDVVGGLARVAVLALALFLLVRLRQERSEDLDATR